MQVLEYGQSLKVERDSPLSELNYNGLQILIEPENKFSFFLFAIFFYPCYS